MKIDFRGLTMRGIGLVLALVVCLPGAEAQETVVYYTTDAVGSVRMVTDSGGAVVARYDYRPFGDPCGTACGPQGTSEKRQFAGSEKDLETGLDYFGARYYQNPSGRFSSTDPVLTPEAFTNPQAWNRYTYTLNNPLRYIDPTGELWVESGNETDPYSWVDECERGRICYTSIAAHVGRTLRVYGSKSAGDVTVFNANAAGLFNAVDLSAHPDAQFESVQQTEEAFLGGAQAAALFNVAGQYAQAFPSDAKLVFTAGSLANGSACCNHRSHQSGANIDLRYMGASGQSLSGATAASQGDIARNMLIISLFYEQRAGLGSPLLGSPGRYGFAPIPAQLQQQHGSHIHFQRTYPRIR
jgi:RHS repeat-associated protein